MKLPSMAYSNGMSAATQTAFGGLTHTVGAGDGELYHMENLTGAYAPVLSSRPPRWKRKTLTQPGGCLPGALCAGWRGNAFTMMGQKRGP